MKRPNTRWRATCVICKKTILHESDIRQGHLGLIDSNGKVSARVVPFEVHSACEWKIMNEIGMFCESKWNIK